MKLSDCLEKIIDNRGKNPKYYDNEKYPVIDNVFIKNNYYINDKEVNRYIDQETFDNFLRGYVEEDMPIMTLVGSGIGNVGIIKNKNVAIVQNTIGFKTKSFLEPKYLYYWFLTKQSQLQHFNRGSGQPSIKKTDVESMEIDIPEKSVQEKIVKVLSLLDDKIIENNETSNNLQEIVRRIFDKEIMQSQKENWTEYSLKDLIEVNNGYSYKGNELVEASDIGMATIKNFDRTGGFKQDGFKPIVPNKIKQTHYAKIFDVLVACTDLTQNAEILGNAIMLLDNGTFKDIIISMDLVKIESKKEWLDNFFIFAILSSKDFKNFALGYKSGTTVLHLNKKCLEDFKIFLPDEQKIREISKLIKINYEKISLLLEENNKLMQIRNSLLPKLISGKMNIENIDI